MTIYVDWILKNSICHMEERCCNILLEQMFCSSVYEPVGSCKKYHRGARNVPVNKMSAFYEPYLRLLGQFFFLKFICLD